MAPPGNAQLGFSLVELMVALVVGLIVSGAAIGFVVSVAKANSEDIQVTRLTQELRSVSEVITRDIRRARFVVDPIGNVAQGAAVTPPLQNDAITVSDAITEGGTGDRYYRCLSLVYDRPSTETAGTVRRTFYLDGGRIYLSNVLCDAVPRPGAAANAISSAEVTITRLSFDNDSTLDNSPAAIDGFVRTGVAGRLAMATGDLASLTRTFQQDTYIRSGRVE